jgi:DNA-directed RNA polymerase subunit RPC12/RpoP
MNKIYKCKYCNKDTSKYKTPRYVCSTCSYKRRYFAGMYWKVLKRDHYKCVSCGKRSNGLKRQLNIHHIDNNPQNNEINNLQTLCIECHAKKRLLICKLCNKKILATSSRQVVCTSCGMILATYKSYIRQERYWMKRNIIRADWYKKEISKLINNNKYLSML